MNTYGKRSFAALAMVCLVATGCDDDDITNPFDNVEEPRIAFASNRDGDFEIWTMNSDGTNPLQLTTDNSADGNKIAYTRTVTAGNIDIYTMNPDGTLKTNVTNAAGNDTQPSFSGHVFLDVLTKFAWTGTRDAATGEIYVTDANNAAVRLTTNTFVDENPSFK